jgi:tungstate transport system permease protein
MESLLDSLRNAVRIVVSLDPDVLSYAGRSLYIALCAVCITSVLAIPLGILIAERAFPLKRLVVTVLNTLLGVPTVVVGLFVYSFVSRQGPLGSLGILFTVPGIIVGEVLLILPLMTALTMAVVARVDREARRTAISLGADERQAMWIVFREARFGILAAVVAGFGRVVGEVGVAVILGGNIQRATRTLTTAIVLDVDMGYFERALALGLVLMTLSFAFNIAFQILQGRARDE